MNGDNYKELSVWVVDDEPGMCRGAERTLRDQVVRLEDVEEEIIFRVTSINTGNEFLRRIEKECPSIVLLDKKLPDADGIDLLAEISERKLPVIPIVITAYASLEKAVKATKLGAYDFLAKPFTPDELRYSVKKAARNVILTEKARQLEKEKKQVRFQFISVLAHEMKSPLNAIEGYTDLIYNKRAGDNIDAYLEMVKRIDHRITGMRKLIADLLDLTSLESGKKQRDIQELNIREIADDVVEGNTERARDKGVEITLECREDITYPADSTDMQMLFNNLVSNAVKYNKDNGKVDVDVSKESDKGLVISVSDTGIGMSHEDQQKLFKEFSRIKNNKTKNIEGSGLGLSIMKKIVSYYKGNVDVESEPDKGTTFTVVLPVN